MVPSVLIVEPYADLRAGIVAALQRRHFVCDAVATPGDAALKLREHDYAHVVVDVDVPDATTELVASLSSSSNVILITDQDPPDADDAEGHHMLRKPFGRDELLAQFIVR
jgi:DNA-binding response OmpR family regulator